MTALYVIGYFSVSALIWFISPFFGIARKGTDDEDTILLGFGCLFWPLAIIVFLVIFVGTLLAKIRLWLFESRSNLYTSVGKIIITVSNTFKRIGTKVPTKALPDHKTEYYRVMDCATCGHPIKPSLK